MDNILITGATGTLGKEIIKQLAGIGQINIISTKENPGFAEQVNSFKADLTDLESLDTVSTAEIIIHCASNPANAKMVDLKGTENLLTVVDKNKLKHFIYVSIAGVDKSQFPYYMIKRAAEQMVIASGIPFTILRATQFHDFVLNRMIKPFDSGVDLKVPAGLKFQSIDITEVAAKIKQLTVGNPANDIITIAGPEILTIEEMSATYLKTLYRTDPVKTEMMPGERFDMLRSGINLCKEHTFGKITWQQYLTTLINHDQL